MTDLIKRIESAVGPSRELFREAYQAIFPSRSLKDHSLKECEAIDLHAYRYFRMIDAEAWTSAVEMLVPEGLAGIVSIDCGYARLEREDGEHWSSDAATPALALCAAALRARGEQS